MTPNAEQGTRPTEPPGPDYDPQVNNADGSLLLFIVTAVVLGGLMVWLGLVMFT